MARETTATSAQTFDDICEQLDSIVEQVRRKDTSLERSLDLFDEAIKLGSAAVEMVDVTELSPAEEAKFASKYSDEQGDSAETDEGISGVIPDAAPEGAMLAHDPVPGASISVAK